MKTVSLRPCACGGRVELLGIGTRFFIHCPVCDHESGTFATRSEATEFWNGGN